MRLFTVNNAESQKVKSSFLLTNKKGGYVSLSGTPVSRYQGVFFGMDDVYKVVEDLVLVGQPELLSVANKFYSVERMRKGMTEKFFMPFGYNALVYELTEAAEFDVLLDCRKSYDTSRFGNNYEIITPIEKLNQTEKSLVGGWEFLTLRFQKKNEDNTQLKYEFFITLASPKMRFVPSGTWMQKDYEYDSQRHSEPNKWYVYNFGRLKTNQLIITCAKSPEKSLAVADSVIKNLETLKLMQNRHAQKIIQSNPKNTKSNVISSAYASAMNSIDQLTGEQNIINANSESLIHGQTRGMYAGLWWFFQFWARDEAISAKALMLQNRISEAKQILFRLIGSIEDGRMRTKTALESDFMAQELFSADATGWTFYRLYELFKKGSLNPEEISTVKKKLKQTIDALEKNHANQEGLIISRPQETWMDSIPRDDCRIEIQAMQLMMYLFMKDISRNPDSKEDMRVHYYYDALLKTMAPIVKERFWNNEDSILRDGILKDESNDETIRPNVFIAYYIYPELLTKEEWARCFENVLKETWLEWGGISTISVNNPLFKGHCTGENSASYHNGDSWYWINNLAAICIHRLDNERFKDKILAILNASTAEILNSGIMGGHAEISSAKEQTSEGCLSQAWSSAMFIELVHEIF